MNGMRVEPNVSVKKFFEEIIPSIFKETLSNTPPSEELKGTEFRIQFQITGENGGVYAVVVKDGKEMEVIPGGISNPMIEIILSESNWRRAISSEVEGILDMFFDPKIRTREKYTSLLGIKGKFHLELSVENREPFNATLRFNSGDSPEVKLMMNAKDYADMVKKELEPAKAFMEGRLRFQGDIGFLMKLQAFMR
jgi:putative sterol carrier protein